MAVSCKLVNESDSSIKIKIDGKNRGVLVHTILDLTTAGELYSQLGKVLDLRRRHVDLIKKKLVAEQEIVNFKNQTEYKDLVEKGEPNG